MALKGKKMSVLAFGLLLALAFVIIRGGNSANYFMARNELPDLALIAVTSFVGAIIALGLSLLFESADWNRLCTPSTLKWTVLAGTVSVLSFLAALRSYNYIPQWLTQAFIGLEPFFATVGLFVVAQVVTDQKTKQGLLEKLPANWWLFIGGLLFVIAGVVMMALSKANSGKIL
jgi:hypothetical protein